MADFPLDLFKRIADRANDPSRRTYMAGAQANAQPLDFNALLGDLQKHGAPGAQGLAGALGGLTKLMGGMPGMTLMGPGGLMSTAPTEPQPIAPPPADADVDGAATVLGRPLPDEFHEQMSQEGKRALAEGIKPIAGAIDFVRSLPASLPRAIASSSSTKWIRAHLAHLGLSDDFGPHLYSGREHVERGKPAPDLYLHAAEQLGVHIARTVILEDSKVGATGALASGARVIGLAAGSHCLDGHADKLRAVGVQEIAHSFDEVARLLGLDQPSI